MEIKWRRVKRPETIGGLALLLLSTGWLVWSWFLELRETALLVGGFAPLLAEVIWRLGPVALFVASGLYLIRQLRKQEQAPARANLEVTEWKHEESAAFTVENLGAEVAVRLRVEVWSKESGEFSRHSIAWMDYDESNLILGPGETGWAILADPITETGDLKGVRFYIAGGRTLDYHCGPSAYFQCDLSIESNPPMRGKAKRVYAMFVTDDGGLELQRQLHIEEDEASSARPARNRNREMVATTSDSRLPDEPNAD